MKAKKNVRFKYKLDFMPLWEQSAHGGLLDILVVTEFEPGSKDESPQSNLLSYEPSAVLVYRNPINWEIEGKQIR